MRPLSKYFLVFFKVILLLTDQSILYNKGMVRHTRRVDMNKKERVDAFFNNQPVDHVPVCFWRHFAQEMERGEDLVEAHLKFYHDTHEDLLKIQGDGFFGWPVPTLQNLKNAEELWNIERLPVDSEFMSGQIERAEKIVKSIDGECRVIYTLFCPLSYLRLQIGWERMMRCMRENPEATMHAVDVIADDENLLIKALIRDAKVDGLLYSVQNAEVTRFTVEEYRKLVEPGDRKCLEFADGISPYIVMHCCGWDADEAGTHNHSESWQNYPSGAVSWASSVDHMSVEDAKKFYHRPVWGGFDNREGSLIHKGTREEIMEETKRLIKKGGNCGFMVGPDCSLPSDISSERIRWIADTAHSISF